MNKTELYEKRKSNGREGNVLFQKGQLGWGPLETCKPEDLHPCFYGLLAVRLNSNLLLSASSNERISYFAE